MRKLISPLFILLTASMLIFSCGDDESPKNQFSAEGESHELTHGYTFLATESEDEDGDAIYVHAIYITGKDLTLDDGLEVTGSDDLIVFGLISSSEDGLDEGTYEFDTDPQAKVVIQVLAYADYEEDEDGDPTYDKVYGGSPALGVEGTIKVSKSGDKYSFKINLTKYFTENEEGETVEADGSLKGYFKGELEELSTSSPVRKPKTFKNPFTEGF